MTREEYEQKRDRIIELLHQHPHEGSPEAQEILVLYAEVQLFQHFAFPEPKTKSNE